MKRVLFVETTHSAIGGVGSRLARLAEMLPERGWDAVFALTRGRRFHDPERYRRNLPPLKSIEMDARTGTSEGRRLAVESAIRSAKPDVILPGAVLDAWIVAAQLKREGAPLRVVYGMPGIDLNALSFVSRHAGMIDAGFGVSPLTAQLLRDFCHVPAERTFVVPTGVRRAARPSTPRPARPIRLLYVGRFDPDKRITDVVPFVDELVARKVDFRLSLVGSGVHARDVEALAARYPERVAVIAPMPVAELYERIYPDADAILLFSKEKEGLPNALLEGMAHGLVPITSDFDGRRELELFSHRQTALVFDVGDVRAAANHVEELIANPQLKEEVGGTARALIERERTVERMAGRFIEVLEVAIAGHPRAGLGPPVPLEGRSRLRRLVGPRAAERIRRLTRRSFAHPDASEWPLIDNIEPPDREREAARLQAAIER